MLRYQQKRFGEDEDYPGRSGRKNSRKYLSRKSGLYDFRHVSFLFISLLPVQK
jgi:hypothetical protein